jgi:hypothetical protein
LWGCGFELRFTHTDRYPPTASVELQKAMVALYEQWWDNLNGDVQFFKIWAMVLSSLWCFTIFAWAVNLFRLRHPFSYKLHHVILVTLLLELVSGLQRALFTNLLQLYFLAHSQSFLSCLCSNCVSVSPLYDSWIPVFIRR